MRGSSTECFDHLILKGLFDLVVASAADCPDAASAADRVRNLPRLAEGSIG